MKRSTLKIIELLIRVGLVITFIVSVFMFFNQYQDMFKPDFEIEVWNNYTINLNNNKSAIVPTIITCSFNKNKIEYKEFCGYIIDRYN